MTRVIAEFEPIQSSGEVKAFLSGRSDSYTPRYAQTACTVTIAVGDRFQTSYGHTVHVVSVDECRAIVSVDDRPERAVIDVPQFREHVSSGYWTRLPSPSPIAGAVAACKRCGLTNEYLSGPYLCWSCRNGA